jgi:hypothetical protein
MENHALTLRKILNQKVRVYGLSYEYRRFLIAVAEEAGILEMW